MQARTIDILTAHDPWMWREKSPDMAGSVLHTLGAEAFRNMYGNLAVAWKFAVRWAMAGVRFNLPMMGKDRWVFRAYMMSLNPRRYFDKEIATAFNFHNPPDGMTHIKSVLNAAILTYHDKTPHSVHLAHIAKALKLPLPAVEAYEALFFNVLDRRVDSQCVAMMLYPNTRLEELNEDYLRTAPHSKILERAGYNARDLDLVTYLAGIGDHKYMAKLAATEDGETRLTRQIIGNGLLLSTLNLLNQRGAGWSRATTLMSAARQGGSQGDDPVMGGLDEYYYQELDKAASMSASFTAERIRADAHTQIVEVQAVVTG